MSDFVFENCVLSYPHLFKAHEVKNTGKLRFGCNLILPENYDWAKLQQDSGQLIQETWPNGQPQNFRYPWSQVTEGPYQGRYQVILNTTDETQFPQVVMQDVSKAGPHQQAEFFAGCIVNGWGSLYAYKNKPGNGLSLFLRGVQLVSNDPSLPRLDSTRDASEIFQAVPGGPAATAAVPGQQAAAPQGPAGSNPHAQNPAGAPAPGMNPGAVPPGAPQQQPAPDQNQTGMPWNQ